MNFSNKIILGTLLFSICAVTLLKAPSVYITNKTSNDIHFGPNCPEMELQGSLTYRDVTIKPGEKDYIYCAAGSINGIQTSKANVTFKGKHNDTYKASTIKIPAWETWELDAVIE